MRRDYASTHLKQPPHLVELLLGFGCDLGCLAVVSAAAVDKDGIRVSIHNVETPVLRHLQNARENEMEIESAHRAER